MAVRIQIRRGTAAEWAAANPVLMEGELGVELDTGKWKTGDGVRAWSDLDYVYDAGAVDALQSDLVRMARAIAGRDGVIYGYGDELKVTPGTGMAVKVGTGAAFVQGRMLEVYDQAETLTITTAHATNPRIDRVVVRVDLSTAQRRAYLAVKTGTPAATPAAPILQQDSTIWEMSLAQVRVAAGATGIVAGNITDERGYASQATEQFLAHLAEGAQKHITESGSNDDGAYMKFDDGTMICRWRSSEVTTDTPVGSLYFGAALGGDFPAVFSDTNYVVTYGIERTAGAPLGARWNKPNVTTRISGLVLFSADEGAKAYISFVAVGRWKA